MLSEFQKALGIEIKESDEESAILVLPIRDELLNTFGIAHGGNHIALGNAAMRALVGPDATQVCSAIEYISKVSAAGVLRAEAHLLRSGKSFVFAEAHLFEDEVLAARVSAQYSRLYKVENVSCQSKPDARSASSSIGLSRPYDVQMPEKERIIRNLFDQGDILNSLVESKDSLCISLQTTEYHAGLDGYVDRAVYGILADNALGFACFAQGHVVVTVRLAVNLIEPVKVGARLFCNAHVDGCSGSIYFSSGNIWSDRRVVGTCEAVFSTVMSLDDFKRTLR